MHNDERHQCGVNWIVNKIGGGGTNMMTTKMISQRTTIRQSATQLTHARSMCMCLFRIGSGSAIILFFSTRFYSRCCGCQRHQRLPACRIEYNKDERTQPPPAAEKKPQRLTTHSESPTTDYIALAVVVTCLLLSADVRGQSDSRLLRTTNYELNYE